MQLVQINIVRGERYPITEISSDGWGIWSGRADVGAVPFSMYYDLTKSAAFPGAIICSPSGLFRPNNCELRFLGTKSRCLEARQRYLFKGIHVFFLGPSISALGRLGKDHFHPHEMRCSRKLF